MENYGNINDRYYRKMKYNNNCTNNRYFYKEYSNNSNRRYESQSTFFTPHNIRTPSKSTLCIHPHQIPPSKSTFTSPHYHQNNSILKNEVSTLPYYIVPVLYVPHKPLYDAKQEVEPHIYRAYHCKSKKQLSKTNDRYKYRYTQSKVSDSKSILNLYTKTRKIHEENSSSNNKDRKNDNYSFEYYDEYIRKYIEGKRSSSDISFCTEKSFGHVLTPKNSLTKNYSSSAEKRKLISKDFPELFGLNVSSKNSSYKIKKNLDDERPTWDCPRTANAYIETETNGSCISQQTSFHTLIQDKKQETHSTQTLIKDISRNVLVMPNDSEKFKKTSKKDAIPEEISQNMNLKNKLSDGQLTTKKTYAFNRSTPRFAVSRLTKSAMPGLFGTSRKSSKKSVTSDIASVI